MAHLALYEDEHLVLQKVTGEPILIIRRKRSAPSIETILSFAGTIRRVFTGIDRSRCAMLVDLRAAPLRSGDDFDRAVSAFRAEVTRDVQAVARLLATSVGALQVKRLDADQARPTRSFANEDDALAWLREQIASSRHPRSRS
jgi:hypothetical protein